MMKLSRKHSKSHDSSFLPDDYLARKAEMRTNTISITGPGRSADG